MAAELYDLEVRHLLLAAQPVPSPTPDWAEILSRGEVRAAPHTRRRLLAAAAVAVVLLVAVGAALATVGEFPGLRDANSIRVETANAQKLVEFRLGSPFGIYPTGTTLAVWRAPASDGLVCTYVEEVPQPAERAGQVGGGGGTCLQGTSPALPDNNSFVTSYAVTSGAGAVFTGQVPASAGVARVALRTAADEEPVAFANGAFIGQLPAGSEDGRFWIVAYDGAGHEVGSVRLPGHPGSS
jgi:hypothetical protein